MSDNCYWCGSTIRDGKYTSVAAGLVMIKVCGKKCKQEYLNSKKSKQVEKSWKERPKQETQYSNETEGCSNPIAKILIWGVLIFLLYALVKACTSTTGRYNPFE